MFNSIVVGIDGTDRGARALEWAARTAEREGAGLTLLAIIDESVVQAYGTPAEDLRGSIEQMLESERARMLECHPNLETSTAIVSGKIVECLTDAAQKHDMIVMGSHHGPSVGETIGGAKGLRVSISTDVPTVVVPADWDPDAERTGIVVGIGPDDSSDDAIQFGVHVALLLDEPLRLVSAWGLPPMLSRSAEAMGGGLQPVGAQFQRNLDAMVARLKEEYPSLQVTGEAVEGSAPSRVLVDCSKECRTLVLGTHSRKALGRAVFGSVTHSVLLNLQTPTVVVPKK
ncbi:universal stress protein [Slackia piriformis]|nr:universal stress protein [Slackia piriformis]